MGGSAGQFVEQVKKDVVKTVEDAGPKSSEYVGDLLNDTGRTVVAAATAGSSELIRETAGEGDRKMREEAVRNAPNPGAPPSAAPPPPSGTPPGEPQKKDPLSETVDEQRRARGRASTILTGRRGLAGTATTARRTLLGV